MAWKHGPSGKLFESMYVFSFFFHFFFWVGGGGGDGVLLKRGSCKQEGIQASAGECPL